MRITTSPRRPASRTAVPASKPRNPVVQAVVHGFGTMTGQRHRDAVRARERFERLDFDQRVREVGEW
ncbi:short-chain dehydrogenase [Variovorax sp. M-6]|uniref:short-chain dehydrogenase n=1 Tax=Variovorax sp. M-6 TaxID=3233041 RepID=UPI003F9BCCD4